MRMIIATGLAALALAGCGGGDSNAPTAEENAELNNAAEMLDTSADSLTVEKPPTAQNWAIGCRAKKRDGDGAWASFGEPVLPRSLYLEQLKERLGPEAVANIQPSAAGERR